MTLALWDESVRLAKIKMGFNPKSFMKIQGDLLKQSQAIYHVLLLNNKVSK